MALTKERFVILLCPWKIGESRNQRKTICEELN